jgi:hypothetical protein
MLRPVISVTIAGVAVALMLGLAGPARAVVIWDEAINGPFGNFDQQTQLGPFAAGDNEIRGTVGQTSPGVFDRDYFSFSVPAGLGLTELIVVNATSAGPLGISFIGIGAGTAITVGPVPTPPDASFLLGWRHYTLGAISWARSEPRCRRWGRPGLRHHCWDRPTTRFGFKRPVYAPHAHTISTLFSPRSRSRQVAPWCWLASLSSQGCDVIAGQDRRQSDELRQEA